MHRPFARGLAAASALILLAACATRPADIQPAYVSPVVYQGLDCAQLTEEHGRLDIALARAVKAQNNARTQDNWGVFLVGLPIGSMRGKRVTEQLAQLKGARATLRRVMSDKGCTVPDDAPPRLSAG